MLAQGVQGPAQIRLADRATLSLPAGRVFLEAEKARRLMGMEQSAWDAATQGLVLPLSKEPQWSAYIDLFDDGHVRDDDTAALDPKSLLAAHKATLAAQNIQRAREGLTLLEITGWFTAPHYDAAQRRFGSCVGATAQGSEDPRDRFVNCSSFILGRQGALKVAVVGDEEQAAVFKGEAAALAEAILYDKGNAYDDADPAKDRIASYGLAALAAAREPARASMSGQRSGDLVLLYHFTGFMDAGQAAEQALAGKGRVLLRYSGTEPKIRLLIEGRDEALINAHADRIADCLVGQIGV